jgi:N-acetylneuraminate synthase
MKLLDYFTNPSVSIRNDQLPFVIAEAGVNHEADMNLAKRLIEEASDAGANAIKFQSYKASTIASKNSPAYWDTSKEPTKTQYELFSKYDKFWKTEFETLREFCESHEIEFMSTPFDSESAKFLSDMVNVFKISSSDITNKPFIEEICSYRKPVILSTGASNLEEIDDAVGWIDQCGVPVALLHCILNYPTLNQDANLGMILDLRNRYPNRLIGYSDHTLPGNMKSLEVATMLGARILEKHFTHDKSLPGNDHYHAMDKTDLKLFLTNIVEVCELIGDSEKKSLEKESLARINARRSLVAKSTISRGSRIDRNQLTWKRPAVGISPKEIDTVVNRIVKKQIEEDEIITWDVLK